MTTRMEETEEQLSEIEGRIVENKRADQKMERKVLDYVSRLRELGDSIQCNNICLIGVPKEEEREKRAEGLFQKIKAENSPNLEKEMDIQIQEAQRTPMKINKSWLTPSRTVIKFEKYTDKKKNPKTGKARGVPDLQVSSRPCHRNLENRKGAA